MRERESARNVKAHSILWKKRERNVKASILYIEIHSPYIVNMVVDSIIIVKVD